MAGKRKGTEDSRHLWPQMLRVIEEVKPTWVIGENVFGIASMAVGQSEIDVESDTDNEDGDNEESGADGVLWTVINDLEQIGYAVQTFVIPACGVNAPHKRDRVWIVANAGCGKRNDTHARRKGLERGGPERSGLSGQSGGAERNQRTEWNKNWLEVATRLCGVDYGLPTGLDGFKLSKAGHRVARLKGLGNAICWPVVVPIMEAIKKDLDDSKD
jgi:DNA (cytosine-5)-methyltransferase 1